MKLLKIIYRNIFDSSHNIILLYNIAYKLHNRRFKVLSLLFKNRLITKYGVHIGLNSKIGRNLFFPHPNGIVIGEGVIIGDNCTIYQQVTLGKSKGNLDSKLDYPVVGNNVTIFAGAKIIGNIKIGDYSRIGANSVVITDVEPYSSYAGIPAKKISRKVL